jgi:hypothetical protein
MAGPIILMVLGVLLNLTVVGAILGVPMFIGGVIWLFVVISRNAKREKLRQEERDDQRFAVMMGAVTGNLGRNQQPAPAPRAEYSPDSWASRDGKANGHDATEG